MSITKGTTDLIIRCQDKINVYTVAALDGPKAATLAAFRHSALRLGKDKAHEEIDFIPVRSVFFSKDNQLHIMRTRLSLDLNVAKQIANNIERYIQNTSRALGDISMSAGAQTWSPIRVARYLDALETDSNSHTDRMRDLLIRKVYEFKKSENYADLMYSANTLNTDIRRTSIHIRGHLVGVAIESRPSIPIRDS